MRSAATLNEHPAWQALAAHWQQTKDVHLRELFAKDPGRGERLAMEAAGIYLDYSKNRITDETLDLLLQLAEQSGLRARIDAMFAGERINTSEKRAVLINEAEPDLRHDSSTNALIRRYRKFRERPR